MRSLAVENISKSFGGVQALRDVNFDVESGTVCALVGENGAGKSTLGKIIAGVERPDQGNVFIDGQPVKFSSSLEAQRHGIAMIFQELDLFPHQTVAQNLVIGNLHLMPRQRGFVSGGKLAGIVAPWLRKVDLAVQPSHRLDSLSIAQVQLVALARALSMNARLLVMDEPTSSLTGDGVDNLFTLIARLKQDGVTILYVSHKMDEIFRIADSIVVMRDGAFVEKLSRAAATPQKVVSLMVGRAEESRLPHASRSTDEELLRVENLHTSKLRGVSFSLKKGEILGVAGLVGSGRSELGDALFGLDRVSQGEMWLRGKKLAPRHPRAAISAGIGLVPEDRKEQGLMLRMSVLENMSFSILDRMQRFGFIRARRLRSQVDETIRRTRLKTPSANVCIDTLSGGNQQKALLSRWLLVDPDVLFLDDPSRGVDVGAKEDIHAIMDDATARGRGIIFVSSELPELLRCSDRILVLCDGASKGILNAVATTQREIMQLATRPAA